MYVCIAGALAGSPACCNAMRNFGNNIGSSLSIPWPHFVSCSLPMSTMSPILKAMEKGQACGEREIDRTHQQTRQRVTDRTFVHPVGVNTGSFVVRRRVCRR